MILLLDVGNTRIKWAYCDGGQLYAQGNAVHRDTDFALLLDQAWSPLEKPAQVLISSVASNARNLVLSEWIENRWDIVARFVVSQAAQLGVRNGYRDPSRLGIDRWVALIAARTRFSGSLCVVDFGSALTIDGLTREGEHIGGLIVPGLSTMHRSLAGGDITLDAGALDRQPATAEMGRDTAEAVGYGIHHCLAYYVDGICSDLSHTLGETPQRIVTGGDAPRMLPLLQGQYQHVADLVLEGLAVIASEQVEDRG